VADFRIHVDDHDAQQRIEKLALFLSDLRPFWPIVKRLVSGQGGWWARMFETEGAFGGTPWTPLDRRYAALKATVFPGKPILQAAGGIRRAASNPTVAAGPRSLTLTIDDSGEEHGVLRTRGPVLQFHQEGAGRLPARPLVFGDPLPAVATTELEASADVFMRDLLGRI
jgi:hypothetical protein